MSHKSKRPVRSIGATKILRTSKAVDEGKVIKTSFSMLLGYYVELVIVVDSKDLFTFLTTRENSIGSSIRADVSVILIEIESGSVDEMVWISCSVNLADLGCKRDSQLTDAFQLTLYNRSIAIDLSKEGKQ